MPPDDHPPPGHGPRGHRGPPGTHPTDLKIQIDRGLETVLIAINKRIAQSDEEIIDLVRRSGPQGEADAEFVREHIKEYSPTFAIKMLAMEKCKRIERVLTELVRSDTSKLAFTPLPRHIVELVGPLRSAMFVSLDEFHMPPHVRQILPRVRISEPHKAIRLVASADWIVFDGQKVGGEILARDSIVALIEGRVKPSAKVLVHVRKHEPEDVALPAELQGRVTEI
jgi:hypothetical protein